MPDAIETQTPEAVQGTPSGRAGASLTIIINNFNYEPFLPAAIESVLNQSVPAQLIVVDDCSTDGSRAAILKYADRLTPVFQPVNSGQGAAFNAGFAQATGDLVLFLDSDDFLLPDAVEHILGNYDEQIALYMYRMRYADEHGALSGVFPPLEAPFAEGDVSSLVRANGRYAGTITSGLVCSRTKLAKIFPLDPEAFRIGADGAVSVALPLHGTVKGSDKVISAYRLHGRQHSNSGPEALTKRARWRIEHDEQRYKLLREESAKLGLPVADDLASKDQLNIRERIVSLMFEPALHPVETDRIDDLLKQARSLTLSQGAGAKRYLRALWWTLLAVLPPAAQRKLFLYEVAPATRPSWFTALVRTLKRRRG